MYQFTAWLMAATVFPTSILAMSRLYIDEQFLLYPDQRVSKDDIRVAIIGSGISGASAAYSINKQSGDIANVNITIFEADSEVGGRIKHVDLFRDPLSSVQVGPTTYSVNDWCMVDAVKDAELDSYPISTEKSWALWNGTEFVLQRPQIERRSSWWEFTKFTWRYGLSPWRLSRAISDASERSRSLGNRYLAMGGVVDDFHLRGLDSRLLNSADEYLDAIGISQRFKQEIIEPRMRQTIGRDLTELTGLDMILNMEEADRVAVSEGMDRLVDRLLRLSYANVRLNSKVESVGHGTSRRYRLTMQNQRDDHKTDDFEFDAVVIAAPFAANNISFNTSILAATKPWRPYITRYVTHIASPQSLPPSFFNVTTPLPDVILTTKPFNDFFSIEYLGQVCNRDQCDDPLVHCDKCDWFYSYRVLSANRLEDDVIAAIVGCDKAASNSSSASTSCTTVGKHGRDWVHTQTWKYAAPQYQKSKPFLNEVEIARFLYYTSAGEELYTSMELNCRLGKNIGEDMLRRMIGWNASWEECRIAD